MKSKIFLGNNGSSQSILATWLAGVCWAACLVATFVLMCPGNATAQLAGKGQITGTVSDKTGAVIPGAQVTATNNATSITVATKTTGAGIYTFSALDPGTYTVTAVAPGFQKLSQENVQVNAMQSVEYDPILTVGSADVQVTVTGQPPQLETSNATLGATMENQTYSALPLMMGAYGSPDQRRATDFIYLMPGVQGNVTNGNATTNTGVINGSGTRGAVATVYIDGLPFVRAGGQGDPRYVWTAISVDAVDQFQLQTSGFSAIYEGQGVMNYSVKQGGSRFHGSVYEFFRNTALDTWGFFGKAPNPATGLPVKPIEHSNEYGINLGGPLIPFGKIKQKLFFFTNYNGFRYSSANPTPLRFPTNLERTGNFSADNVDIYDPLTQDACTAANGGVPCRYQFSYNGVPNVIPPNELSQVALKLQSFLPSITSNDTGNNYIAPNLTGLTNWSTTSRIDYAINPKDTFTVLGAVGRQASSVPVGQTSSGRNTGPLPYNYGQAYAPKTAVWTLEETHTFTPNMLNQIKWGYARYNGPTINPNVNPTYAATTMGLSGLPTGQASDGFPIVTFSGSVAPTQWNGANENRTVAANYTLLDNLQWNVGKHSFTFGGQIAWLLYNVVSATGGSTPITLANTATETAQLSNGYNAQSGTGLSYASFLVGEIDRGSFTQYLQQEFGARFRDISPYVQDDWKVSPKLTLNLGLRYDFYPSVTDVHNAQGFFDPNLDNPITGLKGALQFAGHGTGTCNCSTPVDNYYGNWGPRLGLAYQLDSKTVLRTSYGIMFTHGNAIGGRNTSLGTLGFSAAPSFSHSGSLLSTIPLHGDNGVIPSYTAAAGVASGPAYGTGYTKTSGHTGSPSSMSYNDPYYGGRAPEFINWTFGLQHQFANNLTASATYVGSEGHFLQLDSFHARGYWANDLDPKYLYLGPRLADTGKTATTVTEDCATYNLPCTGLSNFTTSQNLAVLLRPFPFQGVTDNFGYVGNSNYHALQTTLALRSWHGLTLNANYTFSRAIDDVGTFRTGYPIPAGLIANHPDQSYAADRIEHSVSRANQPQHFVATAVWNWPFGKTVFAESPLQRAVMGGFTFSGVYQAYSGSPLALTMASSACQTNPAQSTCVPALNPNFTGSAHQNGSWGDHITLANYNKVSFINSDAFTKAPDYMFGDAARTAPYNLNGPGNYQLDLAMVRSFPLHITEATKLNFRAEWYNVTNHTLFGVASQQVGSSTFGTVTNSSVANRKAAQFSARIEF